MGVDSAQLNRSCSVQRHRNKAGVIFNQQKICAPAIEYVDFLFEKNVETPHNGDRGTFWAVSSAAKTAKRRRRAGAPPVTHATGPCDLLMWHITSPTSHQSGAGPGPAGPGQPGPPTPHFYRQGSGQPGPQPLTFIDRAQAGLVTSIGQIPQGQGATSHHLWWRCDVM